MSRECSRCGIVVKALFGNPAVCDECRIARWKRQDELLHARLDAELARKAESKERHPARYKRRDWLHIAVPFLKSDLGTGGEE